MTNDEKQKYEKMIAKIEGKKDLHDFLRFKLKYLNIALTFMWCVCVLIETLNAITVVPLTIDSELLKVGIISLIIGIPCLFFAESIGIYRKWGISVDVDEARDLLDGKEDKK